MVGTIQIAVSWSGRKLRAKLHSIHLTLVKNQILKRVQTLNAAEDSKKEFHQNTVHFTVAQHVYLS